MADYKRPTGGFRFNFGGMKTNSSPDALAPDKYSIGQNIRALTNNSVRTRPGSTQLFTTGAQPITDIRSYASLGTDNLPRFLARDILDRIYLDTGSLIATLAGAPHPLGATMIPFRPNASPVPYIYAANGQDYQKFSAPSATNVVTASKVGIAEPQSAPEACPDYFLNLREDAAAAVWAVTGTAGAPADITRTTEVLGAAPVVFQDPASNPTVINGFTPLPRVSVRVGGTQQYQIGQFLGVGTSAGIIQDVIPNFSGAGVLIKSIIYFSGTSGRCSIAISSVPGAELLPNIVDGNIATQLQTQQDILSSFRRGGLIQITGAVTEVVMILSATKGPDDSISIEVITVNNQTTATALTLLPTIVLDLSLGHGGDTASSTGISSAIGGAGTGTLTNSTIALATSNLQFTDTGGLARSSNSLLRPDDYFHFSVNVSDITQLSTVAPALRIMFDVNNGAANFTDNYFYYDIQASDLVSAIANSQTQLGATTISAQRQSLRGGLDIASLRGVGGSGENRIALPIDTPPDAVDFGSGGSQTSTGAAQWTEVIFPLRALTRVGNDQSRTLANMQAIRVQVITLAAITLKLSSFWFGGGELPDVGAVGAPYLYRARPRSSVTGAIGNPSPATRYGISPHRQQAVITLPSAAYDSQIDMWDIFRYGGSVTSWRYTGSVASSSAVFVDNLFDDAVQAGDALDFDNFEPWPSIDLPQSLTATVIAGTLMQVTIPTPTNALRWIPGTRVLVNNSQAFTLSARPTLISGTSYLLQFVENCGNGTNVPISIIEPVLGRQPLPYMWGPDSTGTVFACGDPLRLGNLYFCKNNNPDSAPDSYNQEISSPSEPLLGGEVIDGLSYVSSPERWWALYPNATNPAQRYSIIQQPIPRGLAAPYGHCTDGQSLFFWAKDGIWSSSKGSLTDEDLYNIFPHEGVAGQVYTYGAFTIQPPDYSRAGTFRLTYCNYYLFAVYQDSTGTYRRLILDTRRNAWCVDTTPDVAVSVYYHPEQQSGTLLTSGTAYPLLVLGRTDGSVHKETDGTNDGNIPIACAIAPMEWNGGDVRAGMQWGDMILDCFPVAQGSALTATPVVLGVQAAVPSVFAPNINRIQEIVSLGGELTTNYLGLLCQWTDDFTKQATATRLEIWEPSLIPKPEIITDRSTDWYEVAGGSAAFVQGFRMKADTSNVLKNVVVRDADSLSLHSFSPAVQHNGEQKKAYSFNTPFIAHMCRLESTDTVPWRHWEGELEWIAQPTPELAETWTCQPTAHGLTGYMHVARIMAAWASTAPVALTITAFDGQSPAVITLPSTGGAYQKQLFILTANKGVLYTYSASSASPCQIFWEDFEIHVGSWRRQDGYMIFKNIGGNVGNQARI